MTTYAIWEEGGYYPPRCRRRPVTTQAFGEEGGNFYRPSRFVRTLPLPSWERRAHAAAKRRHAPASGGQSRIDMLGSGLGFVHIMSGIVAGD